MTTQASIEAMKIAAYPLSPTPVFLIDPSSGSMMGGGTVNMLTIKATGTTITTGVASAYTAIPDTSIGEEPNAIRLAATAACYVKLGGLTSATPTIVGSGNGYSTGDLITFTGGTGLALTALPATLKLNSIVIDSLGSGYNVADVITLEGGTYTTPADLTLTNLQLVSSVMTAPGSGYARNNVITTAATGGTASTHATLNVDTTKMVSIAINAKGQNYLVGDTLSLVGGTNTVPATVTVTRLELKSAALDTAGIGYVINEVITTAEAAIVPAAFIVTHLQVVSATVTAAGSGNLVAGAGTIVEGTTGTGTKFRASVTIGAAGNIVSVDSVTLAGDYTVNITDINAEPIIYISGNTGTTLTGATLTVRMGVKTVTIQAVGTYLVPTTTFTQASSTGIGTGATFNTGVFQLKTVDIVNAGVYTVNGTTYTSTGGTGTGATFNTPSHGVNTYSIVNKGDYTVKGTALTQNGATTPAGGIGFTANTLLYAPKAWSYSEPGIYSITTPTFTQASVLPTGGSGATFKTASYGILTITTVHPGDYSVLPANPISTTSATGTLATFNMAAAVTAAAGDMLLFPDDAVILNSKGFNNIAAIQVTGAGVLQISPIEN